LNKALLLIASIVLLIGGSASLMSCGKGSSNNQQTSSGLTFRAFISNALSPVGTFHIPVLNIVDASKDQASGFTVSMSGSLTNPGPMLLSWDHTFTLVSSASEPKIAIVTNSSEGVTSTITLPDAASSMAVDPDNATAFAAVRNAPIAGQSQGAVVMLSVSPAGVSATIPVPNVRYIVEDPAGTRLLAFSDSSATATVITKANIGTGTDPRGSICCFDNPVWAVFTPDGNTAYVLECGPECGGSAAAVAKVDMTTNTVGTRVVVPAATMAQVKGSVLWVAGTPPGTACSSGTAAANCGTLTPVDLTSMTAGTSLLITDGYHDRVEVTPDGQLWVGAVNCTDINIPASGSNPGEVRGCLSIVNPSSSAIVIPPQTGDVTGIAPIPGRNVVYVVQGGNFGIYDTTKDKLQPTEFTIVGQLSDVKVVY